MNAFRTVILQIGLITCMGYISTFAFTPALSHSAPQDSTIRRAQGDTTKSKTPWTHLRFRDNDILFRFLIISDRTGSHRKGIFEEGIDKANMLNPDFVLSVGDFIEGYTFNKKEIYRQWEEVEGFVSKLKMPFFYVPGNHDYSNTEMKKIWEEKFGRSYYHFLHEGVLFIIMNLDDEFVVNPPKRISEEQLQYVKDVLDKNRDAKWTFIVGHHPLWQYQLSEFDSIKTYLGDRKFTFIAGHRHKYMYSSIEGKDYIRLGTTGGGMTAQHGTIDEPRGTFFGEFDHLTWVTMTEDGPEIVNLKLDGILPKNISTDSSMKVADEFTKSTKFRDIMLRTSDKRKFKYWVHVKNSTKYQLHFTSKLYANEDFDFPKSIFNASVKPGDSAFAFLLTPKKNDEDMRNKDVGYVYNFRLADNNGRTIVSTKGDYEKKFDTELNRLTFTAQPIFADTMHVAINSDFPNMKICYTLDGSKPTGKSPVYNKHILIDKPTTVRAILVDEDGYESLVYEKKYSKVKLKDAVPGKNITKGGLRYSYYEGEFDSIPSNLSKIKPVKKGIARTFNMDEVRQRDDGNFIIEYKGYVWIPEDGIYHFRNGTLKKNTIVIAGKPLNDPSYIWDTYLQSYQLYLGLKKGYHPVSFYYYNNEMSFKINPYFVDGAGKNQMMEPAQLFY